MEQVEHNYRIEDITLLRPNSQRISRTIIEGVENLTYSISDKTENFLLSKRGSEEQHLTVVRDTFSNTRQEYPQIYRKYIQKLFDSIDPYIDIDFAERDFIKISENSTNSDILVRYVLTPTCEQRN